MLAGRTTCIELDKRIKKLSNVKPRAPTQQWQPRKGNDLQREAEESSAEPAIIRKEAPRNLLATAVGNSEGDQSPPRLNTHSHLELQSFPHSFTTIMLEECHRKLTPSSNLVPVHILQDPKKRSPRRLSLPRQTMLALVLRRDKHAAICCSHGFCHPLLKIETSDPPMGGSGDSIGIVERIWLTLDREANPGS